MERIRIKKIKSLIRTPSFNPHDVFLVIEEDRDGVVYFYDVLKRVCSLRPGEYTIVQIEKIKEESDL